MEIRFHGEAECLRASRLLDKMTDVDVVAVNSDVLTVSTTIGLGKLFARANGELSGVQSVQEVKLPLRELLAKILIERAERPSET